MSMAVNTGEYSSALAIIALAGGKGGQPVGGADIGDCPNLVPKPFQIGDGPRPTTRDQPGLERCRIQRPGRGAGYCRNLDLRVGQKGFQHAPGERAMRTAALQGEVDAFDRGCGQSAVQPPSTLIVVPVI